MKNPIEDIADLGTHYDNESGGDCPAATCSLKIIQIMIAPNDATWQGVLLGLGDDGNVYAAGGCGWEPYFEGKLYRENGEGSGT